MCWHVRSGSWYCFSKCISDGQCCINDNVGLDRRVLLNCDVGLCLCSSALFSPPQVLDLISSDNLNVPSEEEVYRAVLSWVKHDIDGRRQHVPWVRFVPSWHKHWIYSLHQKINHHFSLASAPWSQINLPPPTVPVSWWSVCGCRCWGETFWWAMWTQSCWCVITRSVRTCWLRLWSTTWCLSRGESSATAARARDAVRAPALCSSPLVSVPLKVPIRVHWAIHLTSHSQIVQTSVSLQLEDKNSDIIRFKILM